MNYQVQYMEFRDQLKQMGMALPTKKELYPLIEEYHKLSCEGYKFSLQTIHSIKFTFIWNEGMEGIVREEFREEDLFKEIREYREMKRKYFNGKIQTLDLKCAKLAQKYNMEHEDLKDKKTGYYNLLVLICDMFG